VLGIVHWALLYGKEQVIGGVIRHVFLERHFIEYGHVIDSRVKERGILGCHPDFGTSFQMFMNRGMSIAPVVSSVHLYYFNFLPSETAI
jgi:hypothetical protein